MPRSVTTTEEDEALSLNLSGSLSILQKREKRASYRGSGGMRFAHLFTLSAQDQAKNIQAQACYVRIVFLQLNWLHGLIVILPRLVYVPAAAY